MTNSIIAPTPNVDIPSPVSFAGRDIDHILTMPDGETVNVYRFTPAIGTLTKSVERAGTW